MKIVKVTWLDSCFVGNEWVDKESIKNIPSICHSIGYLLDDVGNSVTIMPHLTTGDSPQASGIMVIPKCSITRVDELQLLLTSVPEGHEHHD